MKGENIKKRKEESFHERCSIASEFAMRREQELGRSGIIRRS